MDARSRLQAFLVVVLALLASPALGQSAPAATAPAAVPASAPSTAPAATQAAVPAAPVAAVEANLEPANPVPAGTTDKPAQVSNIRFQFDKESYRDVVRFIGRCADKPILGDLNVLNGQLTYFDAQPYTYDEAVALVNQVLRNSNFTLMDGGRYLKLLPLAQVPQQSNLPLISGEDLAQRSSQDEIVTAILPLAHVESAQVVTVVARLVHSYGTLAQLEGGRGLIVTDSIDNIRRIRSLLNEIDKGEAAKQPLRYYKLKTASAESTAKLIDQLFGSGQRAAAAGRRGQPPAPNQPAPAAPAVESRDQVTVAADARSNTVVVMASADKQQMIEELLAQVDTEQTAGEGSIRVLALKKQKAAELAKTLMATFGTKSIQSGVDPQGRPIFQQVANARIIADEATNRLVLSGTPDVLKQAEQMVTELDEAAVESSGLRIIPLKVASAASLVQVIQSTFGSQRGPGQRGPGGGTNFSVVADTRTNCLIVNGSAAETEAVVTLVNQLDKSDESRQEIHVARLASGDATQLADALTKMLSQKGGPGAQDSVRIQADRSTNSLIIAAAPGEWKMVESVLQQLTKEAPAATLGSRVFKLKQTKAAEVAGTFQRIFDTRQRQNRSGQPAPAPVVVGFDNASNSLLVSATGDDMSEIERLLQGIDVPADQAAKTSVRNYSLSRSNARELAASLGRLFAADQGRRGQAGEYQPRFEAESNSNQLVISATAEQFDTIEPLLKKLQADASETTTAVRLFPLKNVRAETLAPMVQGIIQADLAAAAGRSGNGRRAEFQVSAEPRSNTLVVSAPGETIKTIEQLLPQLDSSDLKPQVTKVISLDNADAAELAAALNAALSGKGAADRAGRGSQMDLAGLSGKKVVVVPEQSARAVLLTGSTEDVAFAEELIKSIDLRPSSDKPTIKTIKLAYGKADEVANVLNQTVGQMQRTGRGAIPTRISAERNSNSVVVSAASDVAAQVEELIKQIDVAGAQEGAMTIELVALKAAKADALATALNNAQQGARKQPQRPGQTGDEDLVRVTPDAAGNTLLLTGRANQIAEMKKLISQLDQSAGTLTSEMKIFTLKSARASDLAPVLQTILVDAGRQNRRGGPGAPGAPGAQNVPEVRIAAQEQANSLVVQGPPEAIALAEQIIQRFDSEGAAETTIQIFPCTKADAISLADAVNRALAEQGSGGRGPGNQANPRPAENATVVAEPNSNSLLIRGSKIQVAKAMELVKQLDQGGAGAGPSVRVFPLKYAQAGIASKTIDGLFRQINSQGRRNNSVPPPIFSIAADERTNSIIVSAGPPQMAILESLLTNLDSQAETPMRDVQFIPLFRADAVELASKINAMFLDRPKSEQPTIEADVLSNGLTVVAKDADFRAIQVVVEKFDEAAQSTYIQVRVITLQPQARAEKMAEVLKRVYEQVSDNGVTITDRLPQRAASQPADPVGEPMTMGSSAKPAATQPSAATNGNEDILEELASPAPAASAPAVTTRPAAMTAPVIVAVDKASNSLIISAARTEMEAIESLLNQLTSSTATIDYETKIFKIQNDPAAIAKTLNDLYNPRQGQAGQPGAAGAGGQGNRRGPGRGNAPAGANAAANTPNTPPPTLPPQSVTIVADARTKSLIVRAQPSELDMIEPMILQLDRAPTVLSELRVFVLKNTEATEVADNLKAVFGLTPSPGGRNDPRTQQMMRQMIAMRQGGGPGQPNVPPGATPDLGQEYANDPSAGINITSNRMTNSVIVAAPADAMEIAARLVQELDQSPAANGTVVRMFKIAHADVAEVVDALTKVFASPARSAGRRPGPGGAAALAGTGSSGSAAGPAVVAGNDSARTVIVSAAQGQMDEIAKVIQELDKVETAGRTLQFVTLHNARAPELARVLTEVVKSKKRTTAAEEPPTVSGDSSSNALVLAGRKAEVDELIAMAQKLDEAAVDKAGNVHILPLKNANAAATADIIGRLYQQTALAARQGGKSVEVPAITADTRSNALLISATEEQYKAVCELVNQIDEMSPGKDQLRLIQLKNARPEDVLKAIQTLYGSQAQPTVGRPSTPAPRPGQANRSGGNAGAAAARGRPTAALIGGGGGVMAMGGGSSDATVLADQRALLLNANDEDWQAIQKLVKTLDDAAANNRQQVAVIPLEKATNMKVATALQQIFAATARSGYPEDQVSVTALEGTNSIVVTAGKEKMVEVRDLIKQLDVTDIAGEQQFKRFELKNGSAQKVVALLGQMLQPMRLARPTQPITVSADPAGNTVIVVTAAPVMEEIKKMIDALDAVPPFKTADMAIFPLKNAEAAVLASVLSDMLTAGTDKAQTPEARALQEQIRLLKLTKGKENLPPLDLSKPIKITADPPQAGGKSGSNSLIVSSTSENLAALAEIVALLDNVPIAQGVKLQLVHLKNSDANTVMALLKEVFAQGKSLAGKPSTPVAGKAEPESVVGKALTDALSITADTRTNTLVLAGTDEVLALAQLIVKNLDEQATSQFTEVRLFKLINADATEIATLLRGVFAEGAAPAGPAAAGGAARAGGAAASPAVSGARDFVSRLRVVMGKQVKPLETEQGGTYPSLSVTAEKNANILIVAARTDILPLVEELIKAVDIPGAGSMNMIRIYALKNADAQRMQQVVNGLYTGANASLIRAEDKPNITVDTRTNSLVVSSSEKTFATIEALLLKLDAQLPIDLRDIRLVALKNADAGVMAATLQKMMDARVQRQQSLGLKDAESLKVLVMADPRSNALIVGGSAEGFKLVEELAGQLDGASPALSGQIQIIGPFANANAGTLAATLKTLFTERYAQAKTTDVSQQKPVITADLRTNCLLVSANQDDSKIIESLVAKLDAKPVSPAVELAVIGLKFNDSGAIGPVIQRIFADRLKSMTTPGATPNPQDNVSVEIDPLSNALVISASKENLEMIRQLLAKVDVEPAADSGVLKLYPLQHADVTRVSTMLQSLLTQGLYRPGLASAANNATAKAREKVAITADVRTNTLIISAAKENLVVIDQIIAKIDAAEGWGLEGNIQVYPLTYAESDTLSKTLQQLFDRKRQAENQAAGGQGRSLAIVIISDPRTNTLLVTGSKEDIETVTSMVKRLDVVDVARSYDFRIFYLTNASATALEPSLRQLFAERPVVPGTIKTPVTVIANAKMNALIVAADKDDMTAAEGLIKRMDAAPGEGIVIKAVPIIRGDAAALAKTLQQLYDAQKPAGVPSSVTFTSDDRTNTIMVSAPKIEMDNIVNEIERLSTAQVTDVSEIRIYSLQHADAKELATILTDALTNKPKPMGPTSPNRQTLLQFIQQSPDGKKLMASCVKEGVMVTPVERTNALLVQAPSEAIGLLTRLIETMDLADPRSAEIKVFPLRNADATQMAKVLNELFKLQTATANRQAARYSVNGDLSEPPAGGPGGATSGPAVGANFGTADQATLSITVDPRTNCLLVGGTSEHIQLVAKVVAELDASPAEDRQTLVYRLRNAQAPDIQTAIQQFLDQERQRVSQAMGNTSLGAAKELLAREVAVVAEKTSNTLLISGSPRFFETITAIVRELDQPPPQVLINVMLAEVSLDDNTEFGIQWNLLAHPTGSTSIGAKTDFGLTNTAFNFTVNSGDFSLLLRALQAQGRIEVLSRPQITAADNQTATINIGQRVPFVTNSRISETGSVFNTIEYQPVGTILTVTPRISPDGYVRLTVAPEISSMSNSTVRISNDVNAIVIDTREAKTTVTVQDNHSVVIGGLITNRDQHTEEKIPILGDIPLIGLAFKSTVVHKERKELLIILTPRVIRNVTESDVITNQQLRQANVLGQTQGSIGIRELLNPLRGVSASEVERLENTGLERQSGYQPIVIPLRPQQNSGQGTLEQQPSPECPRPQ